MIYVSVMYNHEFCILLSLYSCLSVTSLYAQIDHANYALTQSQCTSALFAIHYMHLYYSYTSIATNAQCMVTKINL